MPLLELGPCCQEQLAEADFTLVAIQSCAISIMILTDAEFQLCAQNAGWRRL